MTRVRLALLGVLLFVTGLAIGFHMFTRRPVLDSAIVASVPIGNRLGFLPSGHDKALLELLAAGKQVNGSAIYNIGIYNYYAGIWRQYGGGAADPSILELGPGANLGQGMLFVATGAKKYSGLDLYMDPELYNVHSYAAAYELLKLAAPASVRLKASEIYSVREGRAVFNPDRMAYLHPRQSYDIPLPEGSLDFAFSHSVFEHISDPEKTVAALWKVLRRGGISAHHFDMRDHADFSKPLAFLAVDEKTWRGNFAGERAYMYTNRKRLSDFVRMIEGTGFRILKVEPGEKVPMNEAIRNGFHPDFRKYSLEDLAIVSALIVAQKP